MQKRIRKKVTFLMLGEIGDVLVTMPVIAAYKSKHIESKIEVIVRKSVLDLYKNNPDIDIITVYDNSSIFRKAKFTLMLFFSSFDLWIDLHTPTFNTICSNEYVGKRNSFLKLLANPTQSTGFNLTGGKSPFTKTLDTPDLEILKEENVVDTTLRLMGQGEFSRTKIIYVDQNSEIWAEKKIKAHVSKNSRVIGFFFGAKQNSDVWPINNVITFIELLLEKNKDVIIFLIGGACETKMSLQVEKHFSKNHDVNRIVNCINKLNLIDSAALIKRFEVFISTDSGPLHMAESVSTDTIALFGSKSYLPVWLPVNGLIKVFNNRPDCSPCFNSECSRDNECMRNILPHDVAFSVLEYLNRNLADVS